MTLLQLRYFMVLSETLHYTKAAEQLHISQPSLSYSISELEKELCIELFNREKHKISLTENGQLFLRYVQNALSVLDEGTRMIRMLNGMYEDRVRLGYFYSLSSPFIPDLVSRFCGDQKSSHIMFDFVQEQNTALIEMLKNGSLDLAFCLTEDSGLQSVPIMQQAMELIVPSDHPLAGKTSVTLDDFCEEPMILLTPKSQARNMVEKIYQDHGKILRVVVEAVECNAAIQFVSLGQGVSILPAIPALELSPVRHLLIEGEEFSRYVYLSWSKNRPLSAGAQLLRQYVLEHWPQA